MKHELGLLENALDSLNEALRKFQAGESGSPRAYKFAVLHFAHSLELLFKYYVTQSHPLLIYKNPFSKSIAKENTIGLWDAVQFLKNEGKGISADLSKDLEWVKQLRNNIEHHKFEMNVQRFEELSVGLYGQQWSSMTNMIFSTCRQTSIQTARRRSTHCQTSIARALPRLGRKHSISQTMAKLTTAPTAGNARQQPWSAIRTNASFARRRWQLSSAANAIRGFQRLRLRFGMMSTLRTLTTSAKAASHISSLANGVAQPGAPADASASAAELRRYSL